MRRVLCAPFVAVVVASVAIAVLDAAAIAFAESVFEDKVERLEYEVVNSLTHDHHSFIQGFLYYPPEDAFYVSNGRRGESNIRKIDARTGQIQQEVMLDNRYFAEGLTLFNDTLIQLTWTLGTVFQYDRKSIQKVAQASYSGEGWGLAISADQSEVFMSDGSSKIRVLDTSESLADAFAHPKREFTVTLRGKPMSNLNELEVVNGALWANMWLSDTILVINPSSGEVQATLDCDGLLRREDIPPQAQPNVLNGIALDPNSGRIWLTGKLWPKIYEIKIKS